MRTVHSRQPANKPTNQSFSWSMIWDEMRVTRWALYRPGHRGPISLVHYSLVYFFGALLRVLVFPLYFHYPLRSIWNKMLLHVYPTRQFHRHCCCCHFNTHSQPLNASKGICSVRNFSGIRHQYNVYKYKRIIPSANRTAYLAFYFFLFFFVSDFSGR